MKKKFVKPTLERKELIDQPLLAGSGGGSVPGTGGDPGGARAKSAFEFSLDF